MGGIREGFLVGRLFRRCVLGREADPCEVEWLDDIELVRNGIPRWGFRAGEAPRCASFVPAVLVLKHALDLGLVVSPGNRVDFTPEAYQRLARGREASPRV